MSQIYDDLLQTLKNLPQSTKLDTHILKKLKNCRLAPSTLLCIHEVLRISAPKKILDKKTILLYFMNLKLVSHNILIDIVVYKTILLLNTKEFIQFMSYMSDIKQKDVLISIFDVYVKENKLDDIFRFLIVNLKNQVFNELVQKDCFIEFIDKLEDKEFMKVFMTYKNRCNLRLRSISNKILKRKYITLLFDTNENKGNGNIKSNENNKENIKSDENKRNGKIKMQDNKENGMMKNDENTEEIIKSDENIKENHNSIWSENKKLKVMTSDSFGLSVNKYTDASTLSLEMNILSCEDFLRFYDFFKDDKQVLLCLIQKRNCCLECANIINDLANDENNKVRAKAIKYADFDNDWILDASKEVRQSAIKRAISMCNDNVLLTMFKGIMTKAQNEYVEALSNIDIDFKFLYDNRNEIGIKQYLVMMKKSGKKLQMRDINDVQNDKKKLRFYVKYFIHDLVDIKQYLADDPYTAYLCLRDRNVENEHAKVLLDKLHKVTNLKHYLRIVVYLSDYIKLNDSYDSAKLIDDKDHIYYSIFDNILAIDIEMTDNVNFSKALFLAKHYDTNDNAKQKIEQYIEENNNKMEVLQIVIYSNSDKLLGHAYKALDSIELNDNVSKIINVHKNTTGLCFYFLQGGNVTIYNPTFIIDVMFCIRNIKDIKENNRIKQIITNYVNKLSISDKNNLLGLVNELKLYRQARTCEYTIHENQIDIRTLPLCDSNMYYACDLIKNQIKNGDECVVNVNRNDLYPVESQYQKFILQLDFTKA